MALANAAQRLVEQNRVGIVGARRLSSVGVKSAPPPNHALLVTTKRVFICTVGTCGFQGWAITESPDAQKRGSASAPGIAWRIAARKSRGRSRRAHPFLEQPAVQHRHATAAARRAGRIDAAPRLQREASRRGARRRPVRLRRAFRFQRLHRRDQAELKRLEPFAGARLPRVRLVHVHRSKGAAQGERKIWLLPRPS